MDMNANLGDIMKEAQKMQERMAKAQEEISNLRVKGEAGGNMVSIEMDGRHNAKDVRIKEALLKDGDVDILEDLVMAAINDAAAKVEKASKEKLAALTADLDLPGTDSK
jgi:nucleoid-associated protein EbfC